MSFNLILKIQSDNKFNFLLCYCSFIWHVKNLHTNLNDLKQMNLNYKVIFHICSSFSQKPKSHTKGIKEPQLDLEPKFHVFTCKRLNKQINKEHTKVVFYIQKLDFMLIQILHPLHPAYIKMSYHPYDNRQQPHADKLSSRFP